MNSELDDIEYEVLNCLYFVETFDKILEDVNASKGVVADCLKTLISKKFVVPMKWEEEKQEYIRSFMYDSDNMNASSYLITKEGLMAHNSR